MSATQRTSRSRTRQPKATASPSPSRHRSGRVSDPPGDPLARTCHKLALGTLWLLFLTLPFVLDSAQKDSFRPLKALLAETLALLSLFFLAFAWKGPAEWRRLARAPFVLAFGPFLLVATAVSLASPHTSHVHRGLVGLWIGALAIWGWSVGFERRELRGALTFLIVPSAILAAIAILQSLGLYQPYSLAGIAQASRYANGSLAGNVGDLAACLVLPAILAQAELVRGKQRGLWALALAVCLYGLAVTQTLAALVAVAAGSAVYWMFQVSRRRALIGTAALLGAGLLLLAVVTPLRERAIAKVGEISRGEWNSVLTGRLDGWRAAVWMVGERPWTGVGVGAYRTEFIPAKTALVQAGVPFFEEQQNVVFANAHNEVLEVVAETGWLGLAALLFGLALLARRLRGWQSGRFTAGAGDEGPSAALAWAGVTAVAVLSLANFPFRIAIALWPICLFLAWIFSSGRGGEGGGLGEGDEGVGAGPKAVGA